MFLIADDILIPTILHLVYQITYHEADLFVFPPSLSCWLLVMWNIQRYSAKIVT